MSQAPDPADRPSESESTPLSTQFPGEMPAPTVRQQEVPYRSLSIMALVGFILGLIYSIVVGLLTLVGLFSGSPTLMAPWTLAIPALAIGVCVLARWLIKRSEGALAGEKLAKVGILLCLFIGLGYWAYRTAVFFAIRQQAQRAVEEWLQLISQKQDYRAMRRTLPPDSQVDYQDDEESLATELTMEFARRSSPDGANPLDSFLSQNYVNQVRVSGDKMNCQLVSTEKLQPSKRGFQVELRYRVNTPYASFDLLIALTGEDSATNKYVGRRWAINMMNTMALQGSMEPTALGSHIQELLSDGGRMMFQWNERLKSQARFVDSYLLTLSPEDRKHARLKLANRYWSAMVGGSPSLTIIEAELQQQPAKLLNGYDEYLKGKLFDLSRMSISEQQRKKLSGTLADFFQAEGASDLTFEFQPQPAMELSWEYTDGIFTVFLPIRITLGSYQEGTIGVGGLIVVRSQVAELSETTPFPDWWLHGIRITSQRPDGQRPPAPPRGP